MAILENGRLTIVQFGSQKLERKTPPKRRDWAGWGQMLSKHWEEYTRALMPSGLLSR
jgi:hypothetical protein